MLYGINGVLQERKRRGAEQWKDEGFSHLENTGVLRNNFPSRKLWPMSVLNISILDSSHFLLAPLYHRLSNSSLSFDVFIPHVFVDYGCVPT